MRTRFAAIAVSLLALTPAYGADEVLVGKEAPKLETVTWCSNLEEELSLEALRGRPVLILFWGLKCEVCMCRNVIKKVVAAHEKFGKQGLAVLGLQTQQAEASEIDVFSLKYGVGFPMGNGGFNQAWGFQQVPRLFLLDPKGIVVWQGEDVGGEFPRKLAEAFRDLDLFGEMALPAPLAPVKKLVQQRQFGKAIQKLIDFAADPKTPDDQREAAKAFQKNLEALADREIVRACSAIRMQDPAKGIRLLERVAEEFKDQPKGREAVLKLKETLAAPEYKPILQAADLYRQFREQVRKGNAGAASGLAQTLFKKFPESVYSKITTKILEWYDKVN
jgi:hypothetical protein